MFYALHIQVIYHLFLPNFVSIIMVADEELEIMFGTEK